MLRLMRIAVAIERLAFDVLHDEVRQAVIGGAAVEQACDVWMIEGSEYLSFLAKAAQDKVGIHAALDQLYRDAHLEFIVDAQAS